MNVEGRKGSAALGLGVVLGQMHRLKVWKLRMFGIRVEHRFEAIADRQRFRI
jgi:hypothetical protein